MEQISYRTLIATRDLARNLAHPGWVVLDCRFSLADPEKGEQDYLLGHIPGALFAHLERDLSGSILPGVTSRHPLPTIEMAADKFAGWGIAPGKQVVVYDDAGGALAAVRAWWMLRWLGHETVAVLDGGWQKWVGENRPVKAGYETRPKAPFIPQPRPGLVVTSDEVDELRINPAYRVFDCRLRERYLGENEIIDPVAGHIPGAVSAPYIDNLRPDGTFRDPQQLAQRFEKLLGEVPPERAIFYCGSGVTSIHNILAMLHAGVGEGLLYAASWSEWITDPHRPVATGEN